MDDNEFKALIEWYATSAEWQGWNSLTLASVNAINAMIDRECESRGYRGWADAHHLLFTA